LHFWPICRGFVQQETTGADIKLMRLPKSLPIFIVILALSGAFYNEAANAQIDPSSALLLKNGGYSSRDSGLDSGRYTVRPRDSAAKQSDSGRGTSRKAQTVSDPVPVNMSTAPDPASSQEVADRKDSTEASGGTNGAANKSAGDKTEATTETKLLIKNDAKPLPSPDVSPEANAPVYPQGKPESQVASQPATGVPSAAEVSYGDRRNNLLDLSIAPGYLYNSSDSSYSFRKYSSGAPTIGAEAGVWFHPGFGINGSYLTSLSGNVNDSADRSKAVPAEQQWFTAGIRAREFFYSSSHSPLLTFGADYYESHFRVPKSAEVRERLTSSGVKLSLEGELPSSQAHAWTVSFGIMPKLFHREESTAVAFKSGGRPDANAVSFGLGSRWQFDRSNALFWKLSFVLEKDLFTGDASLVDPLTNKTPAGVSVTNTSTMFQLGYSWGN
jgi:hypothetical protein